MKVKFWGVRGSIPVSDPKTSKYGGNTSCVELNCDEKTIILDCETGIRALGLDIEERNFVEENRERELYIFLAIFIGTIYRVSLFLGQLGLLPCSLLRGSLFLNLS